MHFVHYRRCFYEAENDLECSSLIIDNVVTTVNKTLRQAKFGQKHTLQSGPDESSRLAGVSPTLLKCVVCDTLRLSGPTSHSATCGQAKLAWLYDPDGKTYHLYHGTMIQAVQNGPQRLDYN